MFTRTARLYDAIYAFKDYQREADVLGRVIETHARIPVRTLLDVGCGTGAHLQWLRQRYSVEGLDLDDGLLEVARTRCPDVVFHVADMAGFELGRSFDTVVSLFGSIAYVRTPERLQAAVACMSRHLAPGGVLALEPFVAPEAFVPGRPHAVFVDEPDLKAARVNVNWRAGRLAVLDFHYLVATPAGVERFEERHELALFTRDEYCSALTAAGLELSEADGPSGRGLYVGVRLSA